MSFASIRENNIPCDNNARVQDHLRESQTRLSERDVSEWKGRETKIEKQEFSKRKKDRAKEKNKG